MGKVFTITEGLENLGAMKTGGQGSVYKGRRIGEIITAIKLLPTPIYAESTEDKNFVDFQNEVQKLKKVNENPNPHVVKILSSGVSDTGNFPFIEMEYIEGPDLEELLKPPHTPIFTIKEALKVADQLSNALAHCHKVGVKHGDIKSNNVKFNVHTGNYVLLDFGLAIMSDEQRRTSLRHAGAIEFMAPEQNEGQMFFQTDVYSFGVILFELLAGTVPFPLQDKGETARNAIRLSHMDTPPPDLLTLRRKALPDIWSDKKKEHEMHVPDWLISMIYKCLQKKPENRFADGIELNEYIVLNSTLAAKKEEAGAEQPDTLKAETKLQREKDQLQQVILKYRQEAAAKDKELEELKAIVMHKDNEVQNLKLRGAPEAVYNQPVQRGVSKTAFIALLLLTLGLAGFAAYTFLTNKGMQIGDIWNTTDSSSHSTTRSDTLSHVTKRPPLVKTSEQTTANHRPVETSTHTTRPNETKDQSETTDQQADDTEKDKANTNNDDQTDNGQKAQDEPEKKAISVGRYKVRGTANFYNQPDETTRRKAFITHWNNAILNALNEQNGFIYVIFTNDEGQVSKGWLRKKDLIPVNE